MAQASGTAVASQCPTSMQARHRVGPLEKGVEISGRFCILHKLAEGAYGCVFTAHDRLTGATVACKVDSQPTYVPPTLLSPATVDEASTAALLEYIQSQHSYEVHTTEVDALVTLRGGHALSCIPKLLESGLFKRSDDMCHTFIIMELLGPCVSSIFTRTASTIAPTVGFFFKVAHSMLNALQALHSTGHIHRDIKPGNVCLRSSPNPFIAPQAALVDLGFVQKRPTSISEAEAEDPFAGTLDFASTRGLSSMRQGPGDDLESMGYALLECWLGELPWAFDADFSRSSLERVRNRRRAIWASLCADHPSSSSPVPLFIQQWVAYASALSPLESGGHAYLRSLLDGARQSYEATQPLPSVLCCQHGSGVMHSSRAHASSQPSYCGVASTSCGVAAGSGAASWSTASACRESSDRGSQPGTGTAAIMLPFTLQHSGSSTRSLGE